MLYKSTILLLIFIPVNFSCSCFFASEEQDFKHADIVARVTVFSESNDLDPTSKIRYGIRYDEVFKPINSTLSLRLPREIATAMDSATCGVKLELGETYLIAGMRENGFLQVGLCSSLNRKWSAVDGNLISNLRTGFHQSTDSNVNPTIPIPDEFALPENNSPI